MINNCTLFVEVIEKSEIETIETKQGNEFKKLDLILGFTKTKVTGEKIINKIKGVAWNQKAIDLAKEVFLKDKILVQCEISAQIKENDKYNNEIYLTIKDFQKTKTIQEEIKEIKQNSQVQDLDLDDLPF